MNRTVEIGTREIRVDGKPVQILSGAMHYFRIHPDYWRDRIVKLRQCGLNTLETYMAWNLHEPREGAFDFSGGRDFCRYLEIAGEEGLMVIVRPGPYICSEWDFGGLPAWLLEKPGLRLRCLNTPYLEAVEHYLDQIIPRLCALQHTKGGPIIAIQLENEYGSYGNDHEYLRFLQQKYLDGGIDVPLFTSDGAEDRMLHCGTLPDVFATVNFRNHPKKNLKKIEEFRPSAPPFVMELWEGGPHHWGEIFPEHDAEAVREDVREVLENHYNMNLYMFHGGSNPGFMNGANISEGRYLPMLSTYDGDAALSEEGDPTPKYFAIQEEIKRFYPDAPTGTPRRLPRRAYGEIRLDEVITLDEALPMLSTPVRAAAPETMERYGQNYGFILYRTTPDLPPGVHSIRLENLRDRAIILNNRRIAGIADRNLPPCSCWISVPPEGGQLDILVENMGRSNFGPDMEEERKGLTGVRANNLIKLFGWEIWPLPLDDLSRLVFRRLDGDALPPVPAFYRGSFTVDEPCDTFLKVPEGSRGCIFLNGVNLGRYWQIGPQRTLYVPAPLLKRGENQLIVFDVEGIRKAVVLSQDKRDFGPRMLMQI